MIEPRVDSEKLKRRVSDNLKRPYATSRMSILAERAGPSTAKEADGRHQSRAKVAKTFVDW
jgi:hypothetical protein